MTVKGTGVYHCHGKKKGKLIKKHKTKAGARRQHRAIMASEKKRKK